MLNKGKAEEQKSSPAQGGPAIPDTKELTLHQKLNLAPISWPEKLMAYEPASATPSFTPAIPTAGKKKKNLRFCLLLMERTGDHIIWQGERKHKPSACLEN